VYNTVSRIKMTSGLINTCRDSRVQLRFGSYKHGGK